MGYTNPELSLYISDNKNFTDLMSMLFKDKPHSSKIMSMTQFGAQVFHHENQQKENIFTLNLYLHCEDMRLWSSCDKSLMTNSHTG